MSSVMSILDTRPEIINMAPSTTALKKVAGFGRTAAVAGQHPGMPDQVGESFGAVRDNDLHVLGQDSLLPRS